MDFNVAAQKAEDGEFRMRTKTGTAAFSAPEILISGLEQYTPKVDVWSAGVVLFMLLCGHLPFESQNVAELADQIVNKDPEIAENLANCTEHARDLVSLMLEKEAELRPTIADCLQHHWLLDGGSSDDKLRQFVTLERQKTSLMGASRQFSMRAQRKRVSNSSEMPEMSIEKIKVTDIYEYLIKHEIQVMPLERMKSTTEAHAKRQTAFKSTA